MRYVLLRLREIEEERKKERTKNKEIKRRTRHRERVRDILFNLSSLSSWTLTVKISDIWKIHFYWFFSRSITVLVQIRNKPMKTRVERVRSLLELSYTRSIIRTGLLVSSSSHDRYKHHMTLHRASLSRILPLPPVLHSSVHQTVFALASIYRHYIEFMRSLKSYLTWNFSSLSD